MRFFRRRSVWSILVLLPVLVCASLVVYSRLPDSHQLYSVPTTERMTVLAFSHDGQLVATGGVSGAIVLWRAATGEHLYTLTGHTSQIIDLAFNPSDTELVSVSNNQVIRRWYIVSDTPQLLPMPNVLASMPITPSTALEEYFQRVTWSEDGTWLAGGTNYGRVFLLDASTGAVLTTIQAYSSNLSDISDLLMNRSHQMIITSGLFDENAIKVWHIPDGILTTTIHDDTIKSWFYTVPDRGRIRLTTDGAQFVWVNKQLDMYEIWSIGGLQLTQIPTRIDLSKQSTFENPNYQAVSYSLSQTSQLLAIGGGVAVHEVRLLWISPGAIHIWEIGQANPLFVLNGHRDVVQAISFSPDGQHLASIGWDNTLRYWRVTP